jgi:hypothetical protein
LSCHQSSLEYNPVFHVSQLQKCVVVEKRVPAQSLDMQ